MKRKNTRTIIKEHFMMNPNSKLRVREIESKLNLSLPSVIRYCKELQEENILTKEVIGNVQLYTADKTSTTFLLEKKLFNIKQVISSNLVGYLKHELSNPVIILFGSYARGEDIEESDIDLYLQTSTKKEINLKKFEKILQRKIQLFKYTSINKITNPHLANNIINGITLNNYLEVFK